MLNAPYFPFLMADTRELSCCLDSVHIPPIIKIWVMTRVFAIRLLGLGLDMADCYVYRDEFR